MIRFILVNAAHLVIKYSQRMRKKYLSIVRRIGKNRAIVAIARLLSETIYTMIKNNKEFVDNIDSMTERKIKAMSARGRNPRKTADMKESIRSMLETRRRSDASRHGRKLIKKKGVTEMS